MTKTNFAILIPVGPGEREQNRLGDLIESVSKYESRVGTILLVNDFDLESGTSTVGKLKQDLDVVKIRNPRRGTGDGWAGGLCVGILEGLKWISAHREHVEFVLKMDTDALCISGFSERISKKLRAEPRLGILGTHKVNPNREPRAYSSWNASIRSHMRTVCVRGKYVQITAWGQARQRRKALVSALKNGYEMGEHCQGGAYGISGSFIRKLSDAGYLNNPLLWLRAGLGEDVMMGILAKAVGFGLSDFNGPGEVFGVQHIGLAGAPEELLNRGYGIIHSVKDSAEYSEVEIRDYFRCVRDGDKIV
jgi:glycosyltransferase involved in cell wall biosynthesis